MWRNWRAKGSRSVLGIQRSAFVISGGQEGVEEPSLQVSDEMEVEGRDGGGKKYCEGSAVKSHPLVLLLYMFCFF